MWRLPLLLLLLLFFPSFAKANQRFTGYCERGGQQVSLSGIIGAPLVQASYPFCTITVYITGTTTLATGLTSDAAGLNPIGNPFTADQFGVFFFYAPNGSRLDINESGAGIPSWTIGDVFFNDTTGGGGGGSVLINNVTVNSPNFTNSTNVNFSVAGAIVTASLNGVALVGATNAFTLANSFAVNPTFAGNPALSLSGAATTGHCAVFGPTTTTLTDGGVCSAAALLTSNNTWAGTQIYNALNTFNAGVVANQITTTCLNTQNVFCANSYGLADASLDVVACLSAAESATGGTCYAGGLGGAQSLSVPIFAGDGTHSTVLTLPSGATWLSTTAFTGGNSCLLTLNSLSDVNGSEPPLQMKIQNGSGTGQIKALMCIPSGGYYRAGYFTIYNPTVPTNSFDGAQFFGGFDGTNIHDFAVVDYRDNFALHVKNMCCGAVLSSGVVNTNYTGGIPTYFDSNPSGTINGLGTINFSTGHPSPGNPCFLLNDTSAVHNSTTWHWGTYCEGPQNDTTTTFIQLTGSGQATFAGTELKAETANSLATGFSVGTSFNTCLNVLGLAMVQGGGNFIYPATAWSNAFTGHSDVTDANGNYGLYSSCRSYFETLTVNSLTLNGPFLTKGPNPRIDAQAKGYGARAVQGIISTTCTTTGSAPYTTLNCANTSGMQAGDGLAVYTAGQAPTQTTPAAPTVTSPVIQGSSSNSYECVGVNQYGEKTIASPVGMVTNDPTVFGNPAITITNVSWTSSVVTLTFSATFDAAFASYTTNTKHVAVNGMGTGLTALNGYWLIATEPAANQLTFALATSGSGTFTGATGRAVNTFIVTGVTRSGTTTTITTDISSGIVVGTYPNVQSFILTGMTPLDMNGYYPLDSTIGDSVIGNTITVHQLAFSANETSSVNGLLSVYEFNLVSCPPLAAPTVQYDIYGTSNPNGTETLIGRTLWGQSSWKDWGYWIRSNSGPFFIAPDEPLTPPAAPINGRSPQTIVGISGNTLTISPGVPTAVSGAYSAHDDAEAVNAAFGSLVSNGLGHTVVLSPPVTAQGGGVNCQFCAYHFMTPVFGFYGNKLSLGAPLSVYSTIVGQFGGFGVVQDPYAVGTNTTSFSTYAYIPVVGAASPMLVLSGETNIINGVSFGLLGPNDQVYDGQNFVELIGATTNAPAGFTFIRDSGFFCGNDSTAVPLAFVGAVGETTVSNPDIICTVPFNFSALGNIVTPGQITLAPPGLTSVLIEASDQGGTQGSGGLLSFEGQMGWSGKGIYLDQHLQNSGSLIQFSFSGGDTSFTDDQEPVNAFLSVNGYDSGNAPEWVNISGVLMDSSDSPVVANFGRGFNWKIQNTLTSDVSSTINGHAIGGLTAINNLQPQAGLGQNYNLSLFIPGNIGSQILESSNVYPGTLGQMGGANQFAGVSACVSSTKAITYGSTFNNIPAVLVFDYTTKGGANLSAGPSTSGFTVSCTGATDSFSWMAIGNPN